MASSKVEIWNMALGHLGISKTISTETERSVEANVCRLFYDSSRQATLRDFNWEFANKMITLILVASNPTSEWGFSYQYPSDCLNAIRIPSGIRNDTRQTRTPFKRTQDDTGQLIYTDAGSAQLEYTWDIDVVERFTPDFVIALSYRLAALVAPSLTGGDPYKLGDACAQKYEMEISKAKINADLESQKEEEPDSEFIRTRN